MRKALGNWSSTKIHNYFLHNESNNTLKSINSNSCIVGGWEQRRPVWLLFLLYQLSEKFAQSEHIPMLDLYLAQYAIESNKRLLSIETPIEVFCIRSTNVNTK